MIHYSQIWSECRKWIITNLWSDIWEFWNKCRFSSTWNPNNSDICDKFELKKDISLFCYISKLCKSRSLTSWATKVSISKSSSPSFCDKHFFSMYFEIIDQLSTLFISDKRSSWYLKNEIFTICSMTQIWHPFSSFFSCEYFFMSVFTQSIEIFISKKIYVSTVSSISSPRTSLWDIFLPSPRDKTRTSYSCYHLDWYFVYEHNFF